MTAGSLQRSRFNLL